MHQTKRITSSNRKHKKETRSNMSSSVARTSKYSYRSSGAAGGSADVSIEYSADLTALSRLEVKIIRHGEDIILLLLVLSMPCFL